ncbi:hypothetical protein B0H17DRAFT_1325664 [Mycena rosella]|uniref:Uncharacterized protein n=1 Tax=Mycena rosella TaxID=1033263 RepID=A0AAD7GWU5_MYCRO|nr:hypothetical protein B0H17DRAFT_1325664 [Mycena rosella]
MSQSQSQTAVGHAAPLRAKIAQFEAGGGVPVPRAGASFGIGAPAPPAAGARRELYGNRMKPVWVPGAGNGSGKGKGLPSPPASPQEGRRDSESASLVHDAELAGVDVDAAAPGEGLVEEIPDDEDEDEDESSGTSSPTDTTSPPASPEREATAPAPARPTSHSLPPTPPLSPIHSAEPDDEPAPAQYGTVAITQTPSTQGQKYSFSAVVHGRVREPPRSARDKRLPPTPARDLPILVQDTAALELPAKAPRRPLVDKAQPATPSAPEARWGGSSAKAKRMFRSLVRKRREGEGEDETAHVHDPDRAPTPPPHDGDVASSLWYAEPAPTPFSNLRKLAATSRRTRKLDTMLTS